jgi:DNA-binding transcriptional ArsR family regulator
MPSKGANPGPLSRFLPVASKSSQKRTGAKRRLAGAAALFAALGDPTRLALLEHLSDRGPASITMLADRFSEMTRQGVTKHLHVLAAAGVIAGAKQGREQVWALNPARIAEAQRHLDVIAREWDDALARLKAHVEGE